MSEIFTIFVVDDTIDENAVEHHKVVQWSYKNLQHPNVIPVTSAQIFHLGNLGVLDIISELNDSMLGEGEDDWVIDNEIKQIILDRLNIDTHTKDEILNKLRALFKYSIKHSRNIYFHF